MKKEGKEQRDVPFLPIHPFTNGARERNCKKKKNGGMGSKKVGRMAKNGLQVKKNSNMHFTHKKASQSAIRSRKIHPYLKKKYTTVQTNPIQSHSGVKMGQKRHSSPSTYIFAMVHFFVSGLFHDLFFYIQQSFPSYDGMGKKN